MTNLIHKVIVNNKEIAHYTLLGYAIEHRNKLRKSGKYATVTTIKL